MHLQDASAPTGATGETPCTKSLSTGQAASHVSSPEAAVDTQPSPRRGRRTFIGLLIAAATQAAEVAAQRYRAGAASLIEVTQARAAQVQAASAVATARNNLALQQTVMAYYTGDLKP